MGKKTYNKIVNSTSTTVKALFNTIKGIIKTGIDVMKKVYKKIPAKSTAKAASNLSSVSRVLSSNTLGVVIGVGSSVVGDISDNAPPAQILNNAMAELLCEVAGIAFGGCVTQVTTTLLIFAFAGLTVPFNPFTVGMVVGFAATIAFDFVSDYVPIGGITLKDRMKRDFNEG